MHSRYALAVDAASLALDFVWIIALRERLWLSVALCTLTFVARLSLIRRRWDVALFVVGGAAAAGSDALQVACGVYTYPVQQLFVLPACMVPVWGQIMLFIASVLATAQPMSPGAPPVPTRAQLALISLAFATALFAVCGLYRTPWHVALASTLAALVMLRIAAARDDLPLVLVAAALGPLAEAILVHNGVYRFAVPTWQQMPLWHPFFWAASLLFVRRAFSALRI